MNTPQTLSIRVEPSCIPVRNAWHLLLYAWDLAKWREMHEGAAEAAPNLVGLLARVLVGATSDLLRRQLGRAHSVTVRELTGIRGRIAFAPSLRRQSFNAGRAVCAFPELSVDTPPNRIIKSTLEWLLSDDSLGIGASASHVQLLRHDIRGVLDRMNGIASTRVRAVDLSTLRLGRNDDLYRLPLTICALILDKEMPTEAHGDRIIAGLLRNEMRFSTLFERFVRNFLKQALTDARVNSEWLSWHDELGSSFVPRMHTDIAIEWLAPAVRRLVIDAKYYRQTLSPRYGDEQRFHTSHLYQIYAYLRTQEHLGGPHTSSAGLLLYPTTSVGVDECMLVQGHTIRIATLDLSQDWKQIEHNLLRLVAC